MKLIKKIYNVLILLSLDVFYLILTGNNYIIIIVICVIFRLRKYANQCKRNHNEGAVVSILCAIIVIVYCCAISYFA